MSDPSDVTRVHATCVAAPDWRDGAPRDQSVPPAVLLSGPSGAGKSDLALRLLDRGWRLVADDQTELLAKAGQLLAQAPKAIIGQLEVRGLGIVPVEAVTRARLRLVVSLVAPGAVERLPEPQVETLLGITLPRLDLDPFAASSAAKVRLALHAILAGSQVAGLDPGPASG